VTEINAEMRENIFVITHVVEVITVLRGGITMEKWSESG
jgi:hypothetical protein